MNGYGQSSPVASNGLVYVTSVSGDMKDINHVEAFELKTGKSVWKHDLKNSTPVKVIIMSVKLPQLRFAMRAE